MTGDGAPDVVDVACVMVRGRFDRPCDDCGDVLPRGHQHRRRFLLVDGEPRVVRSHSPNGECGMVTRPM